MKEKKYQVRFNDVIVLDKVDLRNACRFAIELDSISNVFHQIKVFAYEEDDSISSNPTFLLSN